MLCVDPDSEHAWNSKGLVLKEIGNYKEAMLAFEKVLQIWPHNRDALNNKGALLEKMGQHEEALELFETILQSGGKLEASYI